MKNRAFLAALAVFFAIGAHAADSFYSDEPSLIEPVASVVAPQAPALAAAPSLESAQAFLAGINPRFSAVAAPGDTPELARLKASIRDARAVAAQAGVSRLRAGLSEGGRLSPRALAGAYDGGTAALALTRDLPGLGGDAVRDMIADGAPRQALESVSHLSKRLPALRRGESAKTIEKLSAVLKVQPESPAVSRFAAQMLRARDLLSRSLFGPARAEVRELLQAVLSSDLRQGTQGRLWLEATRLDREIKEAGMAALQRRPGPFSAEELYQRALSPASAPGSYVGDKVSRYDTRLQRRGDCAVQQLYNYPRLAALAERIPYATFLRAVEAKLRKPAAKDGLWDAESGIILQELGFTQFRHKAPKTEDELAALLSSRGALLASIRLGRLKSGRDTAPDHAVVLQGALRESGSWRFILIDSNHARPRVLSFDELEVLGAGDYESLEPMGEHDVRMPEALRGIGDPQERLRVAAGLFVERYGAGRPSGLVRALDRFLDWDLVLPRVRGKAALLRHLPVWAFAAVLAWLPALARPDLAKLFLSRPDGATLAHSLLLAAIVAPVLAAFSWVMATVVDALAPVTLGKAETNEDMDRFFEESAKVKPLKRAARLLVAAASEEALFRGLVFGAGAALLSLFLPVGPALALGGVISALAFSWGHRYGPFWSRFLGGLLLSASLVWSGSFLLPISIHALFNAMHDRWISRGSDS